MVQLAHGTVGDGTLLDCVTRKSPYEDCGPMRLAIL